MSIRWGGGRSSKVSYLSKDQVPCPAWHIHQPPRRSSQSLTAQRRQVQLYDTGAGRPLSLTSSPLGP